MPYLINTVLTVNNDLCDEVWLGETDDAGVKDREVSNGRIVRVILCETYLLFDLLPCSADL